MSDRSRTHGQLVTTADNPTDIRAIVVDAPGAQPRETSIRLPPRTAGSTLVSVLAAPLNPLDLLIASGNFHSARHELPYVPGSECVGIVLESDTHPIGAHVYAQCHPSPSTPGAFATRTLVRDEEVLPLPAGIDPVPAAAVGNSGTAAYMPLIQHAGLRAGETVLILGATGAVGQLAVQVARHAGAGRIVGVARHRDALERLLTLGADAVVDLRTEESETDLATRLLEAAGAVNVILDGLYGLPLQAALTTCAPGARVVNIGNLAGPTAQIPAGLLRGRQITVAGFAGLHTPLLEKHPALEWLWSALHTGALHIDVTAVGLNELPSAWQSQAASPHSKIVALPGGVSPISKDISTPVEF